MKGLLILTIITLVIGLSAATVPKDGECDVNTEFTCLNGGCIPAIWRCDGERDCDYPDESDEVSCPEITCAAGDFQCHGDNYCIPKNWMCDDEWDCNDGSDEMNSTCSDKPTCPANKFTCPGDVLVCIPNAWVCDLDDDCGNGGDEIGCTPEPCQDTYFACVSSGQCIPSKWVCDGEADCGDGSDEADSVCSDKNVTCPSGELECSVGVCIPMQWQCDGDADCLNGRDEEDCGQDKCEYHCASSNICIPHVYVCDGDDDCASGEDEADCPVATCAPDEFTCQDDERCLPRRWLCDGQDDCASGEDEADCPVATCAPDEFSCQDRHTCIPRRWVCDGQDDCIFGGQDEVDCPPSTCPLEEFTCKETKQCIPRRWVCDGDDDCSDRSDEEVAMCQGPMDPSSCSSMEVMCTDGNCIHAAWRCDGDNDCADGSDELNCEIVSCEPGSFVCDDGSCSSAGSKCNGIQDCLDNSDEIGCPVCSLPGKFQCQYEDNSCLDIAQVCDGVDDCLHGEDETECTMQSCDDDNGGCGARTCISAPMGSYCDCGPGYEFTQNGCQDIDECMQTPNPCPGLTCANVPSNYTCNCPSDDYVLDTDGHTCIYANSTPPSLLLTRGRDIVLLDVSRRETSMFAAGSFGRAVGISYDPVLDSVYITDNTERKIHRIISESDGVKMQSIIDIRNADGIAFDWIYRNVYWTDDLSDTISVAAWDGQYKKDLIYEGLDEPRAIVLDPAQGYMYWSDWGENPHIGKASLDGQLRETLVSEDVQWINGLALDYKLQRLYWVDGKLCRIESVRLDGSDRYVVHECPERADNHMFGLAVFQDTLYISDWGTDAILSVNKFSGNNMETLFSNFATPMGLTLKQGYYEAPNLCAEAGNPCSHLCLRSVGAPNGFVCACPDNTMLVPDEHTCMCNNGSRLLEDGISCEVEKVTNCQETPNPCQGLVCVDTQDGASCQCPEGYHQQDKTGTICLLTNPTPPSILVADLQLIKGVDTHLDSLESAVGRFTSATALAYDSTPGQEAFYVSDNFAGTITRVEYKNKEEGNRTVVVSNAGPVFGLAFDQMRRYLYWSDSQRGTISVTPWNGGYTKDLVTRQTGTGILRAVVVDPETGYMYWTDIRPRNASIWRAGLDGSNAEPIVTSSLLRPVSLALVSSEGALYWVDAGLKQIETANTNGSNRQVLLKKALRRPFGIAVHRDKVYWTDGGKSALLSANRFSGEDLQLEMDGLKRPLGIAAAVKAGRVGVPNSCETGGSICSHFCLGAPETVNQRGFSCACPGNNTVLSGSPLSVCMCSDGGFLQADGITCKKPGGDCQRDEFHCVKDETCIPLRATCDGNMDCTDGSDEECTDGCGDWGYQCNSGSCIPTYLRCDGISGDCAEDEDELNCDIHDDLQWCSAVNPLACPGVECINLLNGPQCVCPMGYILDSDGRTCVFSLPTSPRIVIASNGDIVLVDTMDGSVHSVNGDWPAVLSAVYDFDAGYLFVHDRIKNTIERFATSGGFFGEFSVSNGTVLSSSLNSTEGLAYDWIHRNVYLVNTAERSIEVQPYDAQYPLTAVLRNLDKPRAIAVDPNERFMYWTDWGATPMIGKAGLDGSNPTQLVNTGMNWPNGLTLDYQARRVYWVDSYLDRMEYIGFDGDGRRVLIQNNPGIGHPFDLAIHQDKVFWGDWGTSSLYSANKFTGELLSEIVLRLSPMFISVIREYIPHFEAVNYCSGEHGCSHLCLPSPSSPTNYTCACPPTAHLDPTNKNCLCNDNKPLPRDSAACPPEADELIKLPLEVHGVTTLFLSEQTRGKFELQCTVEVTGIKCLPKGAEYAAKWTSNGVSKPWSCTVAP